MKRVALLAVLVATVGLVAAIVFTSSTTETPPHAAKTAASLAVARAAVRDRNWEQAATAAANVLRVRPRDPAALLIAGEAAARLDQFEAGIRHYDAVPESAGADAALARLCSGDLRLKLGRLTEAEDDFRHALESTQQQALARSRLVVVLMLSGRRWEARPHLLELVRRDEASLDVLCSLGDPARLVTNDDELLRLRSLAPDDPLPILGLAARAQVRKGDDEQAELLLRSVIEKHPHLVEAQVQLGDLLVQRGDADSFYVWNRQIPPEAEQHPQLWHVRGMFATTRNETKAAARCFWEVLRREPNHLAASYQLGAALSRLGRPAEAVRMSERARKLQQVTTLITQLHQRPQQIELIHETFDLLRDLGRHWEARAWLQVAMSVDSDAAWIIDERKFFEASPTWEPQQTLTTFIPISWVDCSSYSLPQWAASNVIAKHESGAPSTSTQIRFLQANVGIDFRYFNSPDTSTPGVRMQEFTGGGVGAIDYDSDGRPDLYFTQGCQWPPNLEQRTYLDRLYRNVGDRFSDVTGSTGIVEPGFSQGMTGGDYNGDGFDDIYVSNIGGNRLFRNNGDGTFRDVTGAAMPDRSPLAEAWTISAVMADLNGDTLPDLFDVNYVQGEAVYEMVCGQGGEQRACSPSSFEAQPDRLLLNRGDGTFDDVTSISHVDGPNGTGMGVVAANFDGSGRISLFVANDIQNNHFYANSTPSAGASPVFEEQALLNGLAYDRDGRTQACMGVAAGDSNGDGRLDLFVTNYVDESNILYRQQEDGLFVDDSHTAGVSQPSYHMLGFGTQFLDADLDGQEDLVVANGHIDDFLHKGYEYRMLPQFFRNHRGTFEELPSAGLGAYFTEKKLGRGLARLDWNGDGRDDFAVSHLEDNVALLTNTTNATGGSLSFRLRATESARGAVGTIISVQTGGKTIVRQLTAGDGYQATNEKKLVVGIGEAAQVDLVTITWPSGTIEAFRDLAAGTDWYIIEGQSRPVLRSKNLGVFGGVIDSVSR